MRRRPAEVIVDPDDAEAALEAALRILGGAGHAASVLQRKLQHRGYSTRAAAEAVRKCRELGYVDDTALAVSLVGRHARAGHGRARLIADMRRRGVSSAAAAEALGAIDEDEEVAAATAVAQRLYERELKKGDVDDCARRRIAAALQRRGYSSGVILRALRAVRT